VKNYEPKDTATSGKLITAVYASYVYVYTYICILYIPLPVHKETLYPCSYHNAACFSTYPSLNHYQISRNLCD